jgi:anti-sigma-K factor RskA
MSTPMGPLDHAAADELGAAFALGALEPAELQAVTEHLETCPEPHTELRSFLGAGDALAASLEPEVPSAGLRERLMATVASTSQEHTAGVPAPVTPAVTAREDVHRAGWFDWFSPRRARALAAVAVVVALAFGVWNASLRDELNARNNALQAVAAAIRSGQTAFRVSGTGGSGYLVVDAAGKASFIAAGLTPLEANKLWELWLIGSDKKPVAVGTFRPAGDQVAVVSLERPITGFAIFAVTAESKRVDAPTSLPAMTAKLGG